MGKRNIRQPESQSYAYVGLDRVLHERARLGILMSLLGQAGGRSFGDVKRLCALTDGNLNRHLQVLHQAGLVRIRKGSTAGRALTSCHLTVQGRACFRAYMDELAKVVKDAIALGAAVPPPRISEHKR